MDWITFMEKKRAELMNTGHIMNDETFITHLLNSLPQAEYEGAILVIKDKLRKGPVEIPEIEQVLEDKYQAMKQTKGWEEEEDDYALFASPLNKKGPRKPSKDGVGTAESLDTKQLIVPTRKATKIRVRNRNHSIRKSHMVKETPKAKDILICQKKCFNCGEFGLFARDCPKARDNANMAQESEQSRKSESMLDLDSISVREECAMVCTELQYEDASESEIVYGDQGITTEEYENATYGDLMKTQSENEEDVKCTVAQRANDSVVLERKRRRFNEKNPDKKSDDDKQCDAQINDMSTVNSTNKSTPEVQGPTDDNEKNESRKAWTMEMLMNGSDISMNSTSGGESMSDSERMFLYARAVHSNNSL